MEDLRSVAKCHKVLTACIFIQFLSMLCVFLPDYAGIFGLLFLVSTFAVGSATSLILGAKVMHAGWGILFSLASLVPCLGLIAMVILVQRASNFLEHNGFYVGFFGASLEEIDARIRQRDDAPQS